MCVQYAAAAPKQVAVTSLQSTAMPAASLNESSPRPLACSWLQLLAAEVLPAAQAPFWTSPTSAPARPHLQLDAIGGRRGEDVAALLEFRVSVTGKFPLSPRGQAVVGDAGVRGAWGGCRLSGAGRRGLGGGGPQGG